jgi:hypothetical protein
VAEREKAASVKETFLQKREDHVVTSERGVEAKAAGVTVRSAELAAREAQLKNMDARQKVTLYIGEQRECEEIISKFTICSVRQHMLDMRCIAV